MMLGYAYLKLNLNHFLSHSNNRVFDLPYVKNFFFLMIERWLIGWLVCTKNGNVIFFFTWQFIIFFSAYSEIFVQMNC